MGSGIGTEGTMCFLGESLRAECGFQGDPVGRRGFWDGILKAECGFHGNPVGRRGLWWNPGEQSVVSMGILRGSVGFPGQS